MPARYPLALTRQNRSERIVEPFTTVFVTEHAKGRVGDNITSLFWKQLTEAALKHLPLDIQPDEDIQAVPVLEFDSSDEEVERYLDAMRSEYRIAWSEYIRDFE